MTGDSPTLRSPSKDSLGTASPIAVQRDYYARTAGQYDEWHTMDPHDEHYRALRHVVAYLLWIGCSSVLDTGCGTGRGMRYIADALPGVRVHGNDPSAELLALAAERNGLPSERLDCSSSENLPYPDDAFDAVVETSVLHHVPRPELVISEMLRVARRAVFLSDTNIYGAGPPPARIIKLGLAKAGLLRPVLRLRRGGREWVYTEGDGVAWSYSVFDSYPALESACAEVVVVPTSAGRRGVGALPLLLSPHCLVCGFKEPLPSRSPP